MMRRIKFGPSDLMVSPIGLGCMSMSGCYGEQVDKVCVATIHEAMEQLTDADVSVNNLQIRWLVPLHTEAIESILSKCPKVIIVENNYSGQFARYLRSETGFAAAGHIRKYDGEPFMPHHIADGVKAILAGSTKLYVPVHEIQV